MTLYTVEHDERGERFRRPTADPLGTAGQISASAEPAQPHGLLGAPDPFPLDWVERKPAWLSNGEGVRVVLDGPERGRAAGYVRLHGTCYQDGTGTCRMPPKVPYEQFHRGHAAVVDGDGLLKDVAVGAIAIVGGHSNPRGQVTEAVAHIDRPEKAKLRGVLVEDEVGLLFLGCARSDMTRVEASMVNQSDVSGEWWPLYERDGDGRVALVGHDLIGIALVIGGAFRKEIPERFRVLAAALGRDLDDEEMALMEHDEQAHEAAEGKAESIHHACTCGKPDDAVIAAALETEGWDDTTPRALTADDLMLPLLAAPADEVIELRGLIDQIIARLEEIQFTVETVQRDFMQYKALNMAEEEISLPEQVGSLEEEQRALDRRLADIERRQGDINKNAAAPAERADSTEVRPDNPAGVAATMPSPRQVGVPAGSVR